MSICQAFAREGAHVIGVDLPVLKENLVNEMNKIGAKSYTLDITDRSKYSDLVDYISSSGQIDVLIQNAGVTRDGVFSGLSILNGIKL